MYLNEMQKFFEEMINKFRKIDIYEDDKFNLREYLQNNRLKNIWIWFSNWWVGDWDYIDFIQNKLDEMLKSNDDNLIIQEWEVSYFRFKLYEEKLIFWEVGFIQKYIKRYKRIKYYEKNRDKILEYKREYYKNNTDKCKQYWKESSKRRYKERREEVLKNAKEYYKKNRDRILEYHKKYREENREKINARQRIYNKRMKNKLK